MPKKIKKLEIQPSEARALSQLEIAIGEPIPNVSSFSPIFVHAMTSYGCTGDHVVWLCIAGKKIRSVAQLQGLEDLPFLDTLSLQSNELTDISDLGTLPCAPKLVEMHLEMNQLTDMSGIAKFPALQYLDLSENALTQIAGLEHKPTLWTLKLARNKITRIEGLGHLPELSELDLAENAIQKMEGLDKLPRLHTLNLSGNHIKEIEGLDAIALVLHRLDLENNRITSLKGLRAFQQLRMLDLRGNPIPDRVLREIRGLPPDMGLQDSHYMFPDEDFLQILHYYKVPERLQLVGVSEIRGAFPLGGDWTPDLELAADLPPDCRQQHENNLHTLREAWNDPARRAGLCLDALPFDEEHDIHQNLVQLVDFKGKLLVLGDSVYRVKVAREMGLQYILAIVREEGKNTRQ